MLVIGHRGACGYRPEHTLSSYALAAELGADFIEPDLVVTKDGVLVARHENEISATTDVAEHPELARLWTTKVVRGERVEGWFAEDLTLAQLKTLRSRERIPALRPASALFDGQFAIPTFDEVIDGAHRYGRVLGRPIGVYPELKRPAYFASIGLDVGEILAATLRAHGLDRPEAPVFVQCFDARVLRRLAGELYVPLVQLVASVGSPYDQSLLTPAALRDISTYADAIGPEKTLVIPRTEQGRLGEATPLVADAHDAGLAVHAWTFRSENAFLPDDLRRGSDPTETGDDRAELEAFVAAGVDGVFADQPDVARMVVPDGHTLPAGRPGVVATSPTGGSLTLD